MSSRIKKTTSVLLAASIFFSYGINLYADGDIIETDEPEVEEVTEEPAEAIPEEETYEEIIDVEEADTEEPEDIEEIPVAEESDDITIDDEDVIDISPAANEIVINVDFVNELGEPWKLYSGSQIYGMYFVKTGFIDPFSVDVKVYDENGALLHEGNADYTDADFNSDGQLDLFRRLNNVDYNYRTDPEYFSREVS